MGSLLLLLPLLLWLCWPTSSSSEIYNCKTMEVWGPAKSAYCCATYGVGCPTTTINTIAPTPTVPPTPPPTPRPTPPPPTPPPPTPDPFNCAVDPESMWTPAKKEWCCRVHQKGCPTQFPT